MNLVIDIGNTNIKAAVFDQEQIKNTFRFNSFHELIPLLNTFEGNCLVCNVSNPEISKEISNYLPISLFFTITLPIPINILYQTPETLGLDRIAAAIGAYKLYKKASLVVDIGTCITLDVINEQGDFLGGNISPGPELRFKAMNNFTAALPLEKLDLQSKLIGQSTQEALQSGVKFGIANEILGMYDQLKLQFPSIQLVLTGGYTSFFDSMRKEGIFAEPNLVLIGLNTILNYNVKK